jgi:hypothetical protein
VGAAVGEACRQLSYGIFFEHLRPINTAIMKTKKLFKSLFLAAFSLLAFAAGAQTKDNKPPYDNYCMQMNGGKLVVMYQGKLLTHDVALDNGSRLKPDGTINKKNGDKVLLKEGECVDPEGKIYSAAKNPK